MSQALQTRPREQTEGDCPECAGQVVPEGTEHVCDDCGLVIGEDRIDHRGSRVFIEDEESTERTGAPLTVTRHDRGLSTNIGTDDRDANGNTLTLSVKRKMRRLRLHHRRAQFQGKRERNRAGAFVEIDRMTSALGIGDGREAQACQLFKTYHDEHGILGECVESIAAACVYAVGRINGDAVTAREVGRVARVETKRMQRAYSRVNQALNLPAKPPEPSDYIPRIVSATDAPEAARQTAEQLAEAWREAYPDLSSDPRGVAAGAVYLATRLEGGHVTQEAVAEPVESCSLTVRKRYKEMQGLEVDG